ncbi:MAG: hypothetical protein WCV83_00040 [Candidatus Magasanikbacteria bacterium]
MSKTFLISYDLGIPETGEDYKKVANYLKSFVYWAKALQSLWFVVSDDKGAEVIRDDIQKLTDDNDKILVMDVSGDFWATARIGKEVTDWMNSNI